MLFINATYLLSNLNYNILTFINRLWFRDLASLNWLSIESNHITYIESGAFNSMTQLTILWVDLTQCCSRLSISTDASDGIS